MHRGHCDLVAGTCGGRVAAYGLTLYRSGSRVARLYSIAVGPGFQGRGFSRQILRALHRRAVGRGCDRIRLTVRVDNPKAIKLYESAGYTRCGTLVSYYEDKTSALCFEKCLGRARAGRCGSLESRSAGGFARRVIGRSGKLG